MVNFRFHLVSLTAVFIALAIGIAMGATVVDRATVDFLETRLDGVEANNNRTNEVNERLTADLAEWDRFADQAGEQLVQGRAAGVPVLVVAVVGTSRPAVTAITKSFAAAGAALGGVLWLTPRLEMATADDLSAVAPLVGESESRPVPARQALVASLATALDTTVPQASPVTTATSAVPGPPAFLSSLAEVKGVTYEPPASGGDVSSVPAPGSRIVLVSAEAGGSANGTIAVPLVKALAGANQLVVVADATPEPETAAADAAPFIRPLRADSDLADRITTVDHAGSFRGRLALVLAVVDLGRGRVGHYGTEARATRLIPAP